MRARRARKRGLFVNPRLLAPLFIAALLLAVGAAGTACGGGNGDGELTLEEYFLRFEGAQDEADERFEPLVEALNQEFDSEAEQIEATRDFINADIPILRDFVHAVDDLDPPAEVEDPHEEAVAGGAELVEFLQDFTDRFADVESTSELEELLDAPELEAASDRFDKACFALQDIADANGIDVDLECEDEE